MIPYVIAGCGNLYPEKTKHAAYMALTQWSSTRDKGGHEAVTLEWFKKLQFIKELEQFKKDGQLEGKPQLEEAVDLLDLVKLNEIPIESLHRVSTLLKAKAPRHSIVMESSNLRLPQLENRHDVSVG